jgi:hypothetical protein
MTARTKKYGERGDQFESFDVPFVILKVEKVSLREIADKHFKEEGVESPQAYEKKWAEIHPNKGFVPEQLVFLHTFIRRKFLLRDNYWPGNNAYIEARVSTEQPETKK